MAQNFFDRDATREMDEEYSRRMSSLPKTSLEGFSIPKLVKSESRNVNSSVQNKLLHMAMSSSDPLHQAPNQGVENDWPGNNNPQPNQSWSRPATSTYKNNKKRTFQESSSSKSWANDYDKPMPKSVLELCLEDECKLCGVQITSFIQRKQHYDGAKHEKKVKLELSELYPLDGDESAPKKIKVDSTDMNSCAEMFLKKISNEVSRDTSNLTYNDFKLADWQKKWLEGWDKPIPPQIISMCRSTKCDVCDSTFTSNIMAQSHFEGKNHEKKLKVCLEAFCQQNGLETPRRVVADSEGLSEDFCAVCQVALSSPVMARIHYAGKQHTKKAAQGPPAAVKDNTGRFGIGEGFYKEPAKENTENDDLKEVLKSAASEEGMDGTWGVDKSSEEQRFQNVVNPPSVSFSYPVKQFSPFFCKICNIDLTSKVTYDAHIAGKNHKKKEDLMNKPNQGEFYCDVCDLQLGSLITFEAHIRGKQHAKRAGTRPNGGGGGQFKCSVCVITTTDQHGLTMHLNGKSHQSKLKKINGTV